MASLLDLINKYFPAYTGPGGSQAGRSPTATPQYAAEAKIATDSGKVTKPIFKSPTTVAPASPAVPVVSNQSSPVVPPHYINPKTGKLYTATEVADNIAGTIPESATTPDIPKMAGDQFKNTNQTAEQIQSEAAGVNNTRNDIATGTTDPYGIASKSGISYTPAELKAIEKAYAGIYDPALNSALAKLDSKQKREDQIFATNENIRQWKATTGTKDSSTDSQFTKSQLNAGASNAGLSIDGFTKLDTDLQNFYIQDPKTIDPDTNKSISLGQAFSKAIDNVKAGKENSADVADEITSSNLPESVKHYFVAQLPLTEPVKQGYFAKIWGAITGK